MAAMPVTCRAIAAASSGVSVVRAPCPVRTPATLADPGMTMMRLVPAVRMRASMAARAPLPRAIITITAATPMMMPSAVSAVRITFRRSASSAVSSVSQADMVTSLHRSAGPSAA